MSRGAKRLAAGTIIFGIAGYIAGLLTAPKSGRETRASIKVAGRSSIRSTEKQLKALHTELNQLLGRAKDTAHDTNTLAQDRSSEVKDRVGQEREATVNYGESAKRKVREMLSAVHEGDADDKDLDRAVKDAKKAIGHIRSYLKK